MQTHQDRPDHIKDLTSSVPIFTNRLQRRAHHAKKLKTSKIAAGKDGENPIAEWQSRNVHIIQMPDDEQGILRISIGGGDTPVPLNYCTFRGKHERCVDLLRKVLDALENPRND